MERIREDLMDKGVRKIALDTETTGLDPIKGDRIVEIGGVELIDDLPTGRKIHLYINPQRDVPKEAVRVHGLTNQFLDDKPLFADIADEFLDFIGDAQLVIHNAKFDIGFLDAELNKLGKKPLGIARSIDTMDISRRRFPGSPLTLDALCRRFDVSLEGRELHGALLDAELLGEVWLGLHGGRQPEMVLATEEKTVSAGKVISGARQRPNRLASRLSEADEAGHSAIMTNVDKAARKASNGEHGALWEKPEEDTSSPSP